MSLEAVHTHTHTFNGLCPSVSRQTIIGIRCSMCSDVVVSYEDHRVEPRYRYAMENVEPICTADYLVC